MSKKILTLLGIAAMILTGAQSAWSQNRTMELIPGAKNVGLVIFDGLSIGEWSAPYDVWTHVKGNKVNVFNITEDGRPITTATGIQLQADFSFANAPQIDVLVVPSGAGSSNKDLVNAARINFVKERGKKAEWVTSYCGGAFTLGLAGFLDGKRATTYPGYMKQMQEMFPNTKVDRQARMAVDGNVVSTQGGIAAFEAALYVVEAYFGKQFADDVANTMIYPGSAADPWNRNLQKGYASLDQFKTSIDPVYIGSQKAWEEKRFPEMKKFAK